MSFLKVELLSVQHSSHALEICLCLPSPTDEAQVHKPPPELRLWDFLSLFFIYLHTQLCGRASWLHLNNAFKLIWKQFDSFGEKKNKKSQPHLNGALAKPTSCRVVLESSGSSMWLVLTQEGLFRPKQIPPPFFFLSPTLLSRPLWEMNWTPSAPQHPGKPQPS